MFGIRLGRASAGYATVVSMTTTERKELEHLIEHKILEFSGDLDSGLELKKDFVAELRKRMKKKQKLVSMSVVAKKYGIR